MSIVNSGISKHYAGSMVSDLCPLGYLMDGSSSFLQIKRPTIKAWMGLNFGKIPSLTSELAALERQKKLMNNVVTTLAPSFLIGSSSFFQATSKPIISWMGSKFSRIPPGT